MGKFVIIATLLGLACGILVRKLQDPVGQVVRDEKTLEERRSRRALASGNNDAVVSLSWDLRGNLGSEELLGLPYGARLMAEMTLWSIKAEPEELVAHWDRLMESGEKDMNVLDHYMILWARRDSEGAHAHVKGGEEEYRCLWAIAKIDAPLALNLVDPNNKTCLSKVLRSIGQTDPDYAMTLVDQFPHHNSYESSSGIADGLKDIDPALAVEFSAKQNHFDSDHFRWWLAKDPKAAFAWGIEKKGLVSSSLADLVPMLMAQDAGYFEEQISGLPTGKLKLDLLKAQVKYQATEDPAGALEFANSQEAPLRIQLLHEMGNTLVHEHPDKAHDLFESFLTSEEIKDDGLLLHHPWVNELVTENPERVLETSRRLESNLGEQRLGPMEKAVFNQWMVSDTKAGLEWSRSLGSVERRDGLLSSFITTNSRSNRADHEQLIGLSADISDEVQRETSLGSVVRYWRRADSPGFKEFIESPRATEELREIYQKQLDQK